MAWLAFAELVLNSTNIRLQHVMANSFVKMFFIRNFVIAVLNVSYISKIAAPGKADLVGIAGQEPGASNQHPDI